jgi:hypothetical protein
MPWSDVVVKMKCAGEEACVLGTRQKELLGWMTNGFERATIDY